jgi:hypothetical protein
MDTNYGSNQMSTKEHYSRMAETPATAISPTVDGQIELVLSNLGNAIALADQIRVTLTGSFPLPSNGLGDKNEEEPSIVNRLQRLTYESDALVQTLNIIRESLR